jgi:hypothetical protein
MATFLILEKVHFASAVTPVVLRSQHGFTRVVCLQESVEVDEREQNDSLPVGALALPVYCKFCRIEVCNG